MSYLLTLLIPLMLLVSVLFQSKRDCGCFFSKEYTSVLKGMCCIVVVFIHVPDVYENPVQRVIGCFAYVCVTNFFLISAYGMMKSNERGVVYLKTFWRNRLISLLIPCLFINCLTFFWTYINKEKLSYHLLVYLNEYVKVLLEWCVWFYVIEKLKTKFFPKNKTLEDSLLVGGVVVSSLLYYFCVDAQYSAQAGWCFERMGLGWGVLLYRFYDGFVSWMEKKRLCKIVFLFMLSLLLGACYLKFKMVPFWGAYLLKIILALVIIVTLFIASSNRFFGGKIGLFMGRISYEVYLLHGVVLWEIISLLPENVSSGLYISISLLLTILLAYLISIVDKPIVTLLRKKVK